MSRPPRAMRPTLTPGPVCLVCQLPATGRLHSSPNLMSHAAFRPPVILSDGSRLNPPPVPRLHTHIPVCSEVDCWRFYIATWAAPGYVTVLTGLDSNECGPPLPGEDGRPSLHATHVPKPPRTAAQWLVDYLTAHQGAVCAKDVLNAAQRAGYGRSTIQHASREVGVIKSRQPGGPWLWSPPEPEPEHAHAEAA